MYKQNLHTHTHYCDGLDSPEDVLLEAINKGFNSIGFSGHSYTNLRPNSSSMTPENTLKYKREINRLKEKYQGIIDVYCGLELDLYSNTDVCGYDYIIGSVHYLFEQGEYLSIDTSIQQSKDNVRKYFNGDGLRFARAYYETLNKLPNRAKIDIVGHFDLITKFCEKEKLFDENSSQYKSYALEALHNVANSCRIFEVNTGAIARGYKTIPYPAPFIMKELKMMGCDIVLTSDCHNKKQLDCAFLETIEYIKDCGFDEILYLKDGKFIGQKI